MGLLIAFFYDYNKYWIKKEYLYALIVIKHYGCAILLFQIFNFPAFLLINQLV
jgi:hypothetical protein